MTKFMYSVYFPASLHIRYLISLSIYMAYHLWASALDIIYNLCPYMTLIISACAYDMQLLTLSIRYIFSFQVYVIRCLCIGLQHTETWQAKSTYLCWESCRRGKRRPALRHVDWPRGRTVFWRSTASLPPPRADSSCCFVWSSQESYGSGQSLERYICRWKGRGRCRLS